MTGGLAWVLDKKQRMISETRYHDDFLSAQTFAETTPEQQAALKGLVEEHERLAKSRLAKKLLVEWETAAKDFVLFTPKPQA